MEAARVAALRGHDIVLCEKSKGLGGQLLLAAKPPGREEIENLTRYLVKQVTELKVKIWLGQEVDDALIEEFAPEAIIFATGSVPMTFAEKEEMGDRPCFAHQALTGEIEIGRKVVVIGGGSVGSGTADFLAEKGHDVTLLLRRTDIGSKLEPSTKMVIQRRLEKNGVRIIRKAHFGKFGNGKVSIEREGTEEFLDADNVIIAIGSKPENALYQQMKGRREHVYAIGDCVEPRGIFEAIAEGAMIGRVI